METKRNKSSNIHISIHFLRQVFRTVMAYLRALHYHEPEPELPGSTADLALLVREANFYTLPTLASRAQVRLLETCLERSVNNRVCGPCRFGKHSRS